MVDLRKVLKDKRRYFSGVDVESEGRQKGALRMCLSPT
jgi:hypothetical protein